MSKSRVVFKGDDDFYVGERVYVEVRLFDEIQKTPAVGLSPLLVFTKPDGITAVVDSMVADVADPALYRGSVLVDAEGTWKSAEVRIGSPAETIFRRDDIYVSA